jgi:hypothetical protein
MNLSESVVEDAALIWFWESDYAAGHEPPRAPGKPVAARREPSGRQVQ